MFVDATRRAISMSRAVPEFVLERLGGALSALTHHGMGMRMLLSYTDLLVDESANDTVADFFRARIRDAVDDPAVAERS
jgi:cyclohexanone monooxygenase